MHGHQQMVNTKIRLSIFFLPLIHYDILEITYCRDWNFQQSTDLALYLNADIFSDFSGGPVVRTLCFHSRDLGLIPGEGTKIPKLYGVAKKKKKKKMLISLKGCHALG